MERAKYKYHHIEPDKPKNRCQFDAVVFDVDSTLVTFEGLDWLADYKGKGQEVIKLTMKSMEGHIDFNTAMVQKMQLLAPSYADLVKLGEVYCQNIVAGAQEVVSVLHSWDTEEWILTGNFQPAVGILAQKLGIPPNRIICNQVFFGSNGEYLGFDANSELSQNGGKAKKIKMVADREGKRIAFVGDGMTDLEVKDHVTLFIGFGGVAERDIVKQRADLYISEPSLKQILRIVAEN